MQTSKQVTFYRYKHRKYIFRQERAIAPDGSFKKFRARNGEHRSGFYVSGEFILACFKRGLLVKVLDRYTKQDLTAETLQTALVNYYQLDSTELKQLLNDRQDPKLCELPKFKEWYKCVTQS